MALQALAAYSAVSYSPEMSLDVAVMRDDVMMSKFAVAPENKMIMQKAPLQVPGTYELQTNGSGCAFIQLSVEYNVMTEAPARPAFELNSNVRRVGSSCTTREIRVCARFEPKLEISSSVRKSSIYYCVSSACRYLLEDGYSNMAVIAVKMVSGWSPDKTSVNNVRKQQHFNYFQTRNTV